MTELSISRNLAEIREQIARLGQQYDRAEGSVNLLAVSKTKPVTDILHAFTAGQRHFGENYLQEALVKMEALDHLPIEWHYIGAIQSNKTRPIAEHFSWVHTVASEKVARRLNDQRPARLPPLNVMVQVNLNDEESKAGITPAEVRSLLCAISVLERIAVRGLMAIPRAETDPERQRDNFRTMHHLFSAMKSEFADELPHFCDLSMGMSGDMEAAIAEGSTWLRLGTAIFGERETRNLP